MTRLAIFVSGNGSNMENIVHYIRDKYSHSIEVSCIISDNKEAYAFVRAASLSIPCVHLRKEELVSPSVLLPLLSQYKVDRIILAGYLRLISSFLIDAYPNKILNIHPALLPKYGGRGMYGMHVHKAVCEAGEKETGITIHEIDAEYDKGKIIFQATTTVSSLDTPDTIAEKVHSLEYQYFPRVIVQWIQGKL